MMNSKIWHRKKPSTKIPHAGGITVAHNRDIYLTKSVSNDWSKDYRTPISCITLHSNFSGHTIYRLSNSRPSPKLTDVRSPSLPAAIAIPPPTKAKDWPSSGCIYCTKSSVNSVGLSRQAAHLVSLCLDCYRTVQPGRRVGFRLQSPLVDDQRVNLSLRVYYKEEVSSYVNH
jgi:hypothetical protein